MGPPTDRLGILARLYIFKHIFDHGNKSGCKDVVGEVDLCLNLSVPFSNYWKHIEAVVEAVTVVKVWDSLEGYPAILPIPLQKFRAPAHPDSEFAENTTQGKKIYSWSYSQASLAEC